MTTRYIDAAVPQLQAEGHGIREEATARLSPLKHRDLNRSAAAVSPRPPRRPTPCVRCTTRTQPSSTRVRAR
nr:hypothetical protein [Streptomyces sp. TLI_146]